MVGLEWDMINLLRDLYCRLVLGQVLQPGGQGPGAQQFKDPHNPMQFEQAKTANNPLQGGGILVVPSSIPRQILASLPGLDEAAVRDLEDNMNQKRTAKDQVKSLRLLLVFILYFGLIHRFILSNSFCRRMFFATFFGLQPRVLLNWKEVEAQESLIEQSRRSLF